MGLIGESYYDIDFNKFLYIIDIGRHWDGWKTSVRDKVPQQEAWIKQGLVFHYINDIIRGFEESKMPKQILFTMYQQKWHNKSLPWLKELLFQNLKNQVKRFIKNIKVATMATFFLFQIYVHP